MGTGYTRADVANNIADGNIINSADLDNEYDAIEAAFNSSTGHTHDGTSAEGGPITVVGPVQDLVVSATEVKPKTTNTLDLGTSALLYKDAYLQGNMYFRDTALKIVSSADGQLDIDADVEVEITAPTLDIDASTAVTINTTTLALSGNMTFGDNDKAIFGAGSDLQIYHNGTDSVVDDQGTGKLVLKGNTAVEIRGTNGEDLAGFNMNGAVNLYYDNAAKLATTATGISITGDATFADNGKAIFGAGSDLQIYHDGSNSWLRDTGTGNLYIQGSSAVYIRGENSEFLASFGENSATTLYYDSAAKLATTATGIDVTGTAVTDGLTVAGNVSVDGGTIKLDGNYPVGTGNTALGDSALDDGSLSGNNNVAIGGSALTANTSGAGNVAVGQSAAGVNTTGSSNSVLGNAALLFNQSGSSNVAIGESALSANTTASRNTAVGYQAGYDLTTGQYNSYFGSQAGFNTGAATQYNVGIGSEALANVTNDQNTAVGTSAMSAATSAYRCVAVGMNSLDNVNDSGGWYSTAVGYGSLQSATSGGSNVAVGYLAMSANTTGAQDVAVGYEALDANTSGTYNTAVGYQALNANTTANRNTGIGRTALFSNTTGEYNTALGMNALLSNTTASNNTAVGYQALYDNTTGANNTAIGNYSGYSLTTGDINTFLGRSAGENTTTGSYNTFVGNNSGLNVTTGTKNTILGRYNGNQGGLDIRTSSNYIVLSDGDGNPRIVHNGTSAEFGTGVGTRSLGSLALQANNDNGGFVLIEKTSSSGDGDRFIKFSRADVSIGTIDMNGTTGVSYNTSSDYRLKENVIDMTGATERLKQLNPVRFNFIADADRTVDGFLAHEVQDIVPEAITGTKDEVDADGNAVYQGIDQSKLVPLLVATIQELEARIAALESN